MEVSVRALCAISVLAACIAAPSFAGTLYDNAEGSPILRIIDQARSTLDFEIYEMDDPNVIRAIRRALARGVRVRIVKEPKPVGKACRVFEGYAGDSSCADQQQLVDDVRSAGGSYVPFAEPTLCGADGTHKCVEHGKIAVADSRVALLTSGNFNASNLCDRTVPLSTCNRDYTYVTEDQDVISTLESVVEGDLQGQFYDLPSLISPEAGKKLTVGPFSLDPLVAFIRSAKRKIQIENQYLKEPTINSALMEAARNGVEVDVTLASACAFGKPSASQMRKLSKIFQSFDEVGISTRMFNKRILINGKEGYLHAKAIVVDGERAWMGSVNGSTQATTQNREFGVFFDDAENVGKLSRYLTGDFENPREESWQQSLACAENAK